MFDRALSSSVVQRALPGVKETRIRCLRLRQDGCCDYLKQLFDELGFFERSMLSYRLLDVVQRCKRKRDTESNI